MNELTDLYNIVENILNDMDKEGLYDGYTLSIFKERFEKEFDYYLDKWIDIYLDELLNNRKEEEKDERKR